MKHLFSVFLFVCLLPVYGQSNITGTWNSDEIGTLVLNTNGNGSLAGDNFTFTTTSNKIIATNGYGESMAYNYKLVNGQLTISGGDFTGPVTFTKTKSSTAAAANTKTGNIDKSIVGTWCWTNTSGTYTNASSSSTRCIVINANGTYQYTYEGSISGSGSGYYGGSASQSSDHGTWKLNGTTISVVSANEGAQTLSFQKKNHPKTGDPMIVIDGDAYVTYYQKNPW